MHVRVGLTTCDGVVCTFACVSTVRLVCLHCARVSSCMFLSAVHSGVWLHVKVSCT